MLELRPFKSLGHAHHGWLDANHHFSFGDYVHSERLHWGALRVWNDDVIAPSSGFGKHPHRDMEIITYVREGAITHEDSLGNKGRTEAGDVQVMSAGTGIFHSEFNHETVPTRSFQIWILPNQRGHAPSWGTKTFPKGGRAGQFVVLASGFDADKEALRIHADARVLGVTLKKGGTATYAMGVERLGYLVSAKGAVQIDQTRIEPRDGVALSRMATITVEALDDAEIVLVETAQLD